MREESNNPVVQSTKCWRPLGGGGQILPAVYTFIVVQSLRYLFRRIIVLLILFPLCLPTLP